MSYDFSNLSIPQQELLAFQGWEPRCGRKQPRPSTVRKLVERGLLTERAVAIGLASVTAYDVPLDVHMAWCAHCTDKR